MISKKILFLLILSIPLSYYNSIKSEESKNLSVKIITEVADITDDVANLIVNCKTNKDPEVTKVAVIRLIQHIATITQAIIEKKSEKTHYKSLSTCNIPNDELLDIIAINIVQKANILETEQ